MGKIYYLMGKSASGKDHIYENLIQETALDLKPFVLYTTRPIRSGEQDGREYFFVDEKRLSELREAGKIIEERMYSTEKDVELLNNYHKEVYEKISPYLEGDEKEWLKEATRPISK